MGALETAAVLQLRKQAVKGRGKLISPRRLSFAQCRSTLTLNRKLIGGVLKTTPIDWLETG